MTIAACFGTNRKLEDDIKLNFTTGVFSYTIVWLALLCSAKIEPFV